MPDQSPLKDLSDSELSNRSLSAQRRLKRYEKKVAILKEEVTDLQLFSALITQEMHRRILGENEN